MSPVSPHARATLLAGLEAALEAVDPQRLVERHFDAVDEWPAGRVFLVAVGKAAEAMTLGAIARRGDRLDGGVMILPTPASQQFPRDFEIFRGGHPMPSREGIAGAEAVRSLASQLTTTDHLLVLLSGGASALMTLPPDGVELDEVRDVTRALLRAGARIGELNRVRQHLDLLKGGRLAELAMPARVSALVLSDVLPNDAGERLDVIASGPLTAATTTAHDAIEVMRRFGQWTTAPDSVRSYLSACRDGRGARPPAADDRCFDRVRVSVVGNNSLAARAAVARYEELGYFSRLVTTTLQGEARSVGARLVRDVSKLVGQAIGRKTRAALVAAGETTVTVQGSGRGGRNQELVLAAAIELAEVEGVTIAAIGTDGVDGMTDAAGAIADGSTISRAEGLDLKADELLEDNDSYRFFEALEDLIITGPTGTNVMDLVVILIERKRHSPLRTEDG